MCKFVHSLHKDLRNIYTCKSGTNVYDEVSRNAHNGETNAKKLITRPIMTVTSPNSPHIALTYTKMRFDNFFDQTYPPSWSKLPKCIESGVVFLSGQKSNQNSRISTAKFYYMTLIFGNFPHPVGM